MLRHSYIVPSPKTPSLEWSIPSSNNTFFAKARPIASGKVPLKYHLRKNYLEHKDVDSPIPPTTPFVEPRIS